MWGLPCLLLNLSHKGHLSNLSNTFFFFLLTYKCNIMPCLTGKIHILFLSYMYRVSNKFSYTWNDLFLVNWFISHFFCENTKWKKISSPHYLKISSKLSKHGLSYSLKRDPRSISKITFCANSSVNPIDTQF